MMNAYEQITRRKFLAGAAAAALAAGVDPKLTFTADDKRPWYERALRWGQTNITEKDPTRYDIAWWRGYWKRTQVQGVIINAGGIVAYYPSRLPLQHRGEFLGDRDLFGELARAAHEDGLFVFARMDCSRADEKFYRAHPDWFSIDREGKPYRAGELYQTCVNSPYYEEFIPSVLREIIEREHPEGFTDNSWSGLDRNSICHCANCERKFAGKTGFPIPQRKDWDDRAYRAWIRWNYARRLEIWDLFNSVTRAAGGPQCVWVGMNSGSVISQSERFRDLKEICRRAPILMLDHQSRSNSAGFQQNGETGKLIHGLLGWDKLAPESMAMYQAGQPTFRLSSKPAAEARMWMIEGFAGGIQPWWHHVAAYHEDRRMYRTAEPLMRWHREYEEFLVNRKPVAGVGLVWSQENADFYGRDEADLLVEQPFRGFAQALIRARIPYLPLHADHIEREAAGLSLLILPNLAAMADSQVSAVQRFVERGGALLATGETGIYTESGDSRKGPALGNLLGRTEGPAWSSAAGSPLRRRSAAAEHTYLRIHPELRGRVDGPRTGSEPPVVQERHSVLRGFDETDILPFGGRLEPWQPLRGTQVLLTFIPPFPIYPPETAWMREERTDIPGLILRETAAGSRVAYMPADLDRRFARDNLPDHGDLLANLVRWACKEDFPITVEGRGLVDCHLYSQGDRRILHLVNLSNAASWRAPVHEFLSVGPLRVGLRLRGARRPRGLRLLVARRALPFRWQNGWCRFELPSLLDHEVAVLE